MNTDKATTLLGFIAGLAQVAALFVPGIPGWITGLATALAVAGLGYFTNKGPKP